MPGSYIDFQYNPRNWISAVLNRTTGGSTLYDATYYYQDGSLWNHTGNPLKRVENFGAGSFTTAGSSYFGPWLHMQRSELAPKKWTPC